jgi:hypothetical protein
MFNLSWAGNVSIDFVQLDLGIVPEPTSFALAAAALVGVLLFLRQRSQLSLTKTA